MISSMISSMISPMIGPMIDPDSGSSNLIINTWGPVNIWLG